MTDEHYTTITVNEFVHMKGAITGLREKLQTIRELLEKGEAGKALLLLKQEG